MKKIFYLLILVFMIDCSSQSPNKLWEDAKVMRIKNQLNECFNHLELIIEKYPNHDLAAKAQYQKAEIYLNDIKEYDFAIKEYKRVIEKYPNHDMAKNSLFMIAYIYNNYLNSFTDAIVNYKSFMKKYPYNELIPSVEYELEGLSKIEDTIDSLNLIFLKKAKNNL